MEKEENKQQDEVKQIQYVEGCRRIVCGEFEVSSNVDDIFTLGDLLLQLLEKESVKKYLENFNQRKKSNDVKYLG